MLVVEDNALVADAMRLLFEETGHRVTTAGTIVDVVRAASSDPVDLLLLDLGLSDGDGLEVLDQLRERDALPRVIVALTGRDEPEIVARVQGGGLPRSAAQAGAGRGAAAEVAGVAWRYGAPGVRWSGGPASRGVETP